MFNYLFFQDSQNKLIQNCYFYNKKQDLVIEFITRTEGSHKIYLYINDELVDDCPFYIYVSGDTYTANTLLGVFSPYTYSKSSIYSFSTFNIHSSSTNMDLCANTRSYSGQSAFSQTSSSSTHPELSGFCQALIGNGTIQCAKRDSKFHFVISSKNVQGLCIYGI